MKKYLFFILFLLHTMALVAQDVKVDTLSKPPIPGSFEDLLSKAAAAVVKEDFQTAKTLYTEAVALRPSDPSAIRMLYNVVNTIKSMEEIRLHNLDLKRKADINILLNLAQNEVMQKNYDSAKIHYNQVLSLKPVKSQEDFVRQKLHVIDYAIESASKSTAKNAAPTSTMSSVTKVTKDEPLAGRSVGSNSNTPPNNQPVTRRQIEQPKRDLKGETEPGQQKQPEVKNQSDELKKKAQENESKRIAQENERKIAQERETKRIAQENESKRLAQEAEIKRIAQENENKRVLAENEKKLAQERENKRLAQENENKRLALENEKKLAQEVENKRTAKENENKKIAQENEKKLAQERESKRLAQENENKRLASENEKKLAQQAENKRIGQENENKRVAEENEKRLAQERESRRVAQENENKRIALENEKKLAQENEAKRIAQENETKRIAAAASPTAAVNASEPNARQSNNLEAPAPGSEIARKEKFNTLIESAIKAINASDWEKALGFYNEVLDLNPTPVQQKAIYNEIIVIKRNLDKARTKSSGTNVAKTGSVINNTQPVQKQGAASKPIPSKSTESLSAEIDIKRTGRLLNNTPAVTSNNASDEPIAIAGTEEAAQTDSNKENIEFSQKVLNQPASFNIADINNDVKLTFQGISTNGRNTFFKFLIQNLSPNDFNIGTLQITYIQNYGKLKKLNPRYISSSTATSKEFPFVVVTENQPKIKPDEVFVFEMEDQLKKTKLTLNITGDKFLNKSL